VAALNENAADDTGNVWSAEMMKGVPVVGRAVPWLERNVVPESAHVSPERLESYETEHPIQSTALQTAGSLASTGPLFAAAPGIGGAIGLGAGLNAADTAAAQVAAGSPLDWDQIATDGARGAAGAVIGHYLGNPGDLPGPLQNYIRKYNAVPRWDQLPDKVQNAVGKVIAIGGLGHTIYHGMNHGFDLSHIVEAALALGIGGGAQAAGHGAGGRWGTLIPRAWDTLAGIPNSALSIAHSSPAAKAIVQSGINQISRSMSDEPEPAPSHRRGGRTKRENPAANAAMQRTVKRARAMSGRR
jgi:hypothetical protein